jgi:lauroyl/myristoyl acyltransferase
MPFSLLSGLHRARRRVTLSALRTALAYGEHLSWRESALLGRNLGRIASMVPTLRMRLRTNLHQAGLEATPERVDRYFRLLGDWLASSLALYNRGLAASGVAGTIRLDESIANLDRAVALGRGVVLVSPHAFCHELGAAVINRRHPVVALVRESKNPVRDAIKRRWYEATGLETVLRSRKSSMLADVMSYIRVLRDGKVLAITPDLPVAAEAGVPVKILGRTVSLNPGMVALAMWSGAPMVFCWAQKWDLGRPGHDAATVGFDEPIHVPPTRDRAAALRTGMAEWGRRFEEFLRRDPEFWLFWLDKRWTQVWRGQR